MEIRGNRVVSLNSGSAAKRAGRVMAQMGWPDEIIAGCLEIPIRRVRRWRAQWERERAEWLQRQEPNQVRVDV